MKAKIVDEKHMGSSIYIVQIHIIPENSADSKSIKNMEVGEADINDRTTVEGFINLCLSQHNYSPIDYIGQQGEIFKIKAYKN